MDNSFKKVKYSFLKQLGILKFTHNEFLKILKDQYEAIAFAITNNKDLSKDLLNKSIFEIKIFFFAFSLPILKENLSDELYEKTWNYFFTNIFFSTIDQKEYSEEFLNSFLLDRVNFHLKGLAEKEDIEANNYFRKLGILWFKKPLADINEIESHGPTILDDIHDDNPKIFNYLYGHIEPIEIYSELAPILSKQLKSIIKKTK